MYITWFLEGAPSLGIKCTLQYFIWLGLFTFFVDIQVRTGLVLSFNFYHSILFTYLHVVMATTTCLSLYRPCLWRRRVSMRILHTNMSHYSMHNIKWANFLKKRNPILFLIDGWSLFASITFSKTWKITSHPVMILQRGSIEKLLCPSFHSFISAPHGHGTLAAKHNEGSAKFLSLTRNWTLPPSCPWTARRSKASLDAERQHVFLS